jgi:hypothetical protein
LIEQHARNSQQPGLEELVDRILDSTWRKAEGAGYPGEVQRTVDYVGLARLIDLFANPAATPQTKAILGDKLNALSESLAKEASSKRTSPTLRAHYMQGHRMIGDYFAHPGDYVPLKHAAPPPGAPIGDQYDCGF